MLMQEILTWISAQLCILKNILVFLAPAIPMTIKLTLVSFAFALFLGFLVGIARLSKNKLIKSLSKIYIDMIRGIPLLVQIFFIYFGLGKVLNLDRFLAGVIAIGMVTVGYTPKLTVGQCISVYFRLFQKDQRLIFNDIKFVLREVRVASHIFQQVKG